MYEQSFICLIMKGAERAEHLDLTCMDIIFKNQILGEFENTTVLLDYLFMR